MEHLVHLCRLKGFCKTRGRCLYRGINIVGLIGDPGCPVKITLVIIYAKDDTPLAGCHKTVQCVCF